MAAMIEWKCVHCGQKQTRIESMGRPLPGACPRNNARPHEWFENRRWGN